MFKNTNCFYLLTPKNVFGAFSRKYQEIFLQLQIKKKKCS